MNLKKRTRPDGSSLPSMGDGVVPLVEHEEWWVDPKYGGPIFESVLTDENFSESGLSRIVQHMQGDNSFAFISAATHHYLKEKDPEDRDALMQSELRKNSRRHEQLKADVRALGLGFVNMEGGYTYTDPKYAKKGVQIIEKSLMVPGIKREDAIRLAKKYGQESILFKDENEFVVLGSNGSVFEKFAPGKFTFNPSEMKDGFAKFAKARARQFSFVPMHKAPVAESEVGDPAITFLRVVESCEPGAKAARLHRYYGRGDLLEGIRREYIVEPNGLGESELEKIKSATFLEADDDDDDNDDDDDDDDDDGKKDVSESAGDVFARNQKKVLMDTLAMAPEIAKLFGGITPKEAEDILRKKFKMSDSQIEKAKNGKPLRSVTESVMVSGGEIEIPDRFLRVIERAVKRYESKSLSTLVSMWGEVRGGPMNLNRIAITLALAEKKFERAVD